jgi:hypothetical protein
MTFVSIFDILIKVKKKYYLHYCLLLCNITIVYINTKSEGYLIITLLYKH